MLRLTHRRAFAHVFDNPTKVKYKHFLAFCRPNALSYPRLGIMLGKRYVKRAVDRNLLKRLIRESFRHHQSRLHPVDIIILMTAPWETLDKPFWRAIIDELMLYLSHLKMRDYNSQ